MVYTGWMIDFGFMALDFNFKFWILDFIQILDLQSDSYGYMVVQLYGDMVIW